MKNSLEETLKNAHRSLVVSNTRPYELDILPANLDTVEVLWKDAFIRHAKRTEEDAKKIAPVTVVRMGYIIKEDDEMLLMSSELSVYPDEKIYVRDTIAIPKANIIEIIHLNR